MHSCACMEVSKWVMLIHSLKDSLNAVVSFATPSENARWVFISNIAAQLQSSVVKCISHAYHCFTIAQA